MITKVTILIAAFILQIISIVREYKKEKEIKKLKKKNSQKGKNRPVQIPRKNYWGSLHLISKILVAGGIVFVAVNDIYIGENNSNVNAKTGELNTPVSITRPIIMFGPFGSSVRQYQLSTPYDHLIQIWRENSQLMAIINIRDHSGATIGYINGKDWHINNLEDIDYNNDKNGFEVVTGDRKVLFQLNYKNDTAYCYGMLCDSYKNCVYLDSEVSFSDTITGNDKRFPLIGNLHIKPLFEYPRDKYLGIRNHDNN